MAVEPCGHGQHLAEAAPALAATHIVNIWRGMVADPLKLSSTPPCPPGSMTVMRATGVRHACPPGRAVVVIGVQPTRPERRSPKHTPTPPGSNGWRCLRASFEEMIQVITTGNVRDPCDVLPVPIQQLPRSSQGRGEDPGGSGREPAVHQRHRRRIRVRPYRRTRNLI